MNIRTENKDMSCVSKDEIADKDLSIEIQWTVGNSFSRDVRVLHSACHAQCGVHVSTGSLGRSVWTCG